MSPRTPLFDPAEYFSSSDTWRRDGMVAFVAYAVANGILTYAIVQLVIDQVTGLPGSVRTQALSRAIPVALFGTVVAWLVVAAIMHYLGGSESEVGTFGDALAVAGWAYVPNLLAQPILFFVVRSRVESLSLDVNDPDRFAAEVEAAQGDLYFGAIPLVVHLIVIGWSVYVLAHGTAETHDVPFEPAIGAAALVGIGSFLLLVLNGL